QGNRNRLGRTSIPRSSTCRCRYTTVTPQTVDELKRAIPTLTEARDARADQVPLARREDNHPKEWELSRLHKTMCSRGIGPPRAHGLLVIDEGGERPATDGRETNHVRTAHTDTEPRRRGPGGEGPPRDPAGPAVVGLASRRRRLVVDLGVRHERREYLQHD